MVSWRRRLESGKREDTIEEVPADDAEHNFDLFSKCRWSTRSKAIMVNSFTGACAVKLWGFYFVDDCFPFLTKKSIDLMQPLV
jgi:hypothetical protein